MWACCGGLAGCTGGRVVMVPFSRVDLPPHEPLVQEIHAPEAYYWLEDDKTLWLALRSSPGWPGGEGTGRQWLMTLKLEGLPAGRQRLYKLDDHSIRGVLHQGMVHQRFVSLMGVAVLGAPRAGLLSGRFHASLRQQQFAALSGGWTPEIFRAPLLVCVGELHARPSEEAVRGIRALTEAEDFTHERGMGHPLVRPGPLPSTAPAATAAGP